MVIFHIRVLFISGKQTQQHSFDELLLVLKICFIVPPFRHYLQFMLKWKQREGDRRQEIENVF